MFSKHFIFYCSRKWQLTMNDHLKQGRSEAGRRSARGVEVQHVAMSGGTWTHDQAPGARRGDDVHPTHGPRPTRDPPHVPTRYSERAAGAATSGQVHGRLLQLDLHVGHDVGRGPTRRLAAAGL